MVHLQHAISTTANNVYIHRSQNYIATLFSNWGLCPLWWEPTKGFPLSVMPYAWRALLIMHKSWKGVIAFNYHSIMHPWEMRALNCLMVIYIRTNIRFTKYNSGKTDSIHTQCWWYVINAQLFISYANKRSTRLGLITRVCMHNREESPRFLVMDMDRERGCPTSGIGVWSRRKACTKLHSGAILPFSAASLLWSSALFGHSKCQSKRQAKNPL